MSKPTVSILALLTLLTAMETLAENDDREAILALVDRALTAVDSNDPSVWDDLQLAEGTSLSFRPHPNGNAGELEFRMSTNEALAATSAGDDYDLVEAWTDEPTVMIHGPIAVVWGAYDFWVDGEFSHCGIDSVDLVKLAEGWKIANWMWTVEKENCPTDPAE